MGGAETGCTGEVRGKEILSAKLVSKDGSTGSVGSCVVAFILNPSLDFGVISRGGRFFVKSDLDDFPPSPKNLVFDFFGAGDEGTLASVSYPVVGFFFLPNLLFRVGASVSYPWQAKLSLTSMAFLVPRDVKLVALCRSTSFLPLSSAACASSSFTSAPSFPPTFFPPALSSLLKFSFCFPFISLA